MRCGFVAPVCHVDHRTVIRVNDSNRVGAAPTEFSVFETRITSYFNDAVETAVLVKSVEAEKLVEAVFARRLPDAVTGTT